MARRRHLRLVTGTEGISDQVSSAQVKYGDLADRRLASILAAEDTAESYGLGPYARSTCQVHRCWLHQCIAEPVHVSAVTGHRWCLECECPVDVDIDEVGAVRLRCSRCGGQPDTTANREVLLACRTSLSAMHAGTRAELYEIPEE
ncbi:hypothetical protein LWC34_50040 [Kibdelosporangium philippinense]|uniref:Hydrogenase maturation factor HypA n=1 Tax=Kibdelosporangium philippinense TaxID=211113 RepID=A0ABS8ZT38_9PSEU|nr:hypothetical protein [Kibdelosporangium philippinense]MCE7010894.1 hypothetical protein [Kibdelosporangium philippinense]